MSDTKPSVHREIARTRERMAETVDEIDTRIAERVSSAKQRLDIAQLVRDHPWPALSVAAAIGAFIGGSGADEKAAAAAAEAAKRAANATAEGAKSTAAKLRHRNDHDTTLEREPSEALTESESKRGFGDRLFTAASAPLAGAIDRVLDEMRAASRDWGIRLAGAARSGRASTVPSTTTVEVLVETHPAEAEIQQAADVVPVPPEMLPTEVDARADAVEALGGGTHEPPLEPGAGDLGARWA